MLDKNGLIAKFIEIYGGDASDVRIFSSPGRVNL
ncbi:MAG: galactokinase family protein, partial [Ruminococcaceae bacterium]|nr:galactokinase family protein [Oscillospiraceae bacterium]